MSVFGKYGFSGSLRMIINIVRTRIFYRPARLIRFPIDIRNKKYISFGKGFTTGRYCRLEAYPINPEQINCISIGDNVQINDSVHIVGSIGVSIGNNVLLASKIFISDSSHGLYDTADADGPESIPKDRPLQYRRVVLEDNVWIGEFVSILPGVTIGRGAIIGTMSVVTKNIPAYSIAVGTPARVIKKYNFETKKWEKIYHNE